MYDPPTLRDIKWLKVCKFAAKEFSTCGKRQYFAVVVGANGRLVGSGYNGAPPGITHCIDGGCPRWQENSPPGSSYNNCIAIHAEENALLWSDRTARESGTLYVNGPPCWECGKRIGGSGIAKLVYIEDESYEDFPRVLGIIEAAGVATVGVDDSYI